MIDPFRPWGIPECAEYLGVSASHFGRAVRYTEGFPVPLSQYTYTLGKRQHKSAPEWAGIDVMAWRLGPERITLFLRQAPKTPA